MDSSKSEPPSNIARVFASVGVVLAYFIGKALPIPGLQWKDMPGDGGLFERILEYSNFSLGSLGANPITGAFMAVEIAAFAVPPWRKLRNGSESGRKKLVRAALVMTFVLVFAQGFAISQTMQGMLPVSTASVLGAYVTWTAALLGLAHWTDRFGAFGGIPNLILAEIIFSLVKNLAGEAGAGVGPDVLSQLGLLFLALPVLTGRQWSSDAPARGGTTLFPWFVAGIVPLNLAVSALNWPSIVDSFVGEQSRVRETTALLVEHPWWIIGVLAAALFLLAPAFHRVGPLQTLDRLLGLGTELLSREKARFSRARNLSFIYLVLVLAAALFVWRKGGAIDFAPFIFAAICLDARSHLQFRAIYPDAICIYESHRVYWAVHIADALRADGFEVHLSGLRHRSLLHFFAPYVPVRILVPVLDAEEARGLLSPLILKGLPAAPDHGAPVEAENGLADDTGPNAETAERSFPPLLPGLWVILGLAATAGAVRMLPTEPVWEPIPGGTMAVYEIDESHSAFTRQELVNCQGVEAREYSGRAQSGRVKVAFSSDLALLELCVDAVELAEGRRLLFEREFRPARAVSGSEIRQEPVGWRTVLVHDPPAIFAEDMWGFTERDDGSLVVAFQDPQFFERVTARNLEKRIAFVLMGEVVAAPRINEPISGGRTELLPYPTEEGLGPLLQELRARQQ